MMKAYITLLSNESYLPGVLVLGRSLKKVKAKYPLYCALSINIKEEVEYVLNQNGISCVRLLQKAVDIEVNQQVNTHSHWNYTFDKLLIWGLTQFDKLVFLDSDMLVLRNIDGLFEFKQFSAVCADHSYIGNEHWTGLNSGLIVIEPDKNIEKKLLMAIRPVLNEMRLKNQPVGDQDVIKSILPDWADNPTLHLDEGYNLFADHLTYYVRKLGYSFNDKKEKKIYVVHFIGKTKPWMKKNLRVYLWLFFMLIKNPLYFRAYRLFVSYLR